MQDKTDAELVGVYADSGDDSAFEALVMRHRKMVYRACLRILCDCQEAEDATQAVFIVLMKKAAGLRRNSNLGPWLYRVANYVADRARRGRGRRMARETEAVTNSSDSRPTGEVPEAGMSDMLERVDAALMQISGVLREAVVLRYLQGLSEQEAATYAGCPVGTMKWRTSEGLAKLRAKMAKRGVSLGAVALIGLLDAEAKAAIPETLLSSITTAVKMAATSAAGTAATGGKAMMLAKSVLKSMFWAKVKMAALVVAILVCVLTGSVIAEKQMTKPNDRTSADVKTATAPDAQTVTITPRTPDAWMAFDKLSLCGGPKVTMLFRRGGPYLVVPSELRFNPVTGRKLIDDVAATRQLKVVWVRDGRCAVLYKGVSDGEVERVKKELASVDVTVRRQAVWSAGWMWDVRAVPLLVKAAKDTDIETARQAVIGLRRAGWEAVVAVDETAVELLIADLNSPSADVRMQAVSALWIVDGEEKQAILAKKLLAKAIDDNELLGGYRVACVLGYISGAQKPALIEQAINSTNAYVRLGAVSSLRGDGGDKSLALLEKALSDPERQIRRGAVEALGRIGGDKAVALLERVLDDKDESVRSSVIQALGNAGGDKALALLEKTLNDQNHQVRGLALRALGWLGSDRAFALVEKSFANNDPNVRQGATVALSIIGGDKALALIGKALSDNDPEVRRTAVAGLLYTAGGDKALPLIERTLSDKESKVRLSAFSALISMDSDRSMALLNKVFDDNDEVRRAVISGLQYCGDKAIPVIERALADEKCQGQAFLALDTIGGEKELVILEKAIGNKDNGMRHGAVESLCRIGGERALTILEEALNGKDFAIHNAAAQCLGRIGGVRARDLLLKQLTEKNVNVLPMVVNTLKKEFPGDPVVEKALKDFKMPAPQARPSLKVEQEVLE